MSVKKVKLTSKSLNSFGDSNKPSTITRAAITAEIKPTRGKQLVEHNPFALIPDPSNPRPDDVWLEKYLLIGRDDCLCKYDENNEFVIPEFNQLNQEIPRSLVDDYEFLRSLAFSIRNDGLIEPIEIFLADKINDPEYFINSKLEYGYVVLEGHQRRLAGIMAGVKTLTCIEITDETMLARLKVKHRKLRRQLSENNLRKGLTVGQNFKVVSELLKSDDCKNITAKELSSIVGLNEEIAGALKRLTLLNEKYPNKMLHLVHESLVSFKWIRTWISKPFSEIESECSRILSGNLPIQNFSEPKVKARGRSGGAVKRSATFKVKKESDSKVLQNYLFKMIPDLNTNDLDESPFSSLEKILNQLLELAKSHQSDPGRI